MSILIWIFIFIRVHSSIYTYIYIYTHVGRYIWDALSLDHKVNMDEGHDERPIPAPLRQRPT